MSDIHSRTLHLGSGIAGGTSWGRRSWTRLGCGSTHFAVFQKRILKQKLWPKMPKMLQFFSKIAVKNWLSIGSTAPTQPPLATVDCGFCPQIRGSDTNYYKLSQRAFLALGWGLEHIFTKGG